MERTQVGQDDSASDGVSSERCVSRGPGRAAGPSHWYAWERTVIRWLALHTNVTWPQGVRTVQEADQEIRTVQPSLRATSMNCEV